MKKFFLILSLGLAFSCDTKKSVPLSPKPDSLLSEEQMISFLVDVQILEGKIKALNLKRDSAEVLFTYYEKELYKEHGFSDSVYLKSYRYYLENTEEMADIYQAVYDSLELRNKAFEEKLKKKKEEKKKEEKKKED
ncbi:DUF4296 domain-containing protein [Xanthovirga aplysinae]|uniref:DUF4296 domain-containing protein n=1 Tax=Xanthovirga aplysinae TaxID=2529853 RepID=UPI0012BD1C91|nr:DUF4296 domain-containing protein [Xanthovirga aplysinae]